jgi:putative (di)nucleoside polyphosphate hydrolase
MQTDDLPYRPNVCILIFNKEKKLLLAERKGEQGVWQFPQGGVELDQSIESNVLREIEEELGIKEFLCEIIGSLPARNRYDFDITPEYARGVWRGQDQTFWVVRFLGEDSDISVHTQHPEFDTWAWLTVAEISQRAEPKRLIGYREALEQFSKMQDSL